MRGIVAPSKLFALLAAAAIMSCVEEKSGTMSVAEISTASSEAAEAMVIDAPTAKREDFPAVCSFPTSPPCTCVLVGAHAALTARHCVNPTNQPIREETRFRREVEIFGQGTREQECLPALQPDLDLAICRVDTGNSVAFENVGSLPSGASVALTGFGCAEFLSAQNEGALRQRSITPSSRGDAALIELGAQFLCGGDSGGPGYVLLSSETDAERVRGPRLVVGINHSRTDLTSTTTQAARDFFNRWERENPDSRICGVTPGAQGCRPL